MRINEIFLTEDDGDKHMTFCFGRFNPPTLGHKQVFKAMQKTGGEMEIYTSQTQDAKKNPLDYSTKVSFIRNIHPEFANNVVENTDMNTLPKICTSLHERGFNHITFVAGSDRLDMMSKLIKDYNGVEGKGHGYYKFETMNFNSSGQREDGSDGVVTIPTPAASSFLFLFFSYFSIDFLADFIIALSCAASWRFVFSL